MGQNPGQGPGPFAGIIDLVTENPIPAAVTLLVVLVATFFLCCRSSPSPPAPKPSAPKVSNGASKEVDAKEEDNKDEIDGTDKGEPKGTPAEEKETQDTKEEPEGGINLDNKKED